MWQRLQVLDGLCSLDKGLPGHRPGFAFLLNILTFEQFHFVIELTQRQDRGVSAGKCRAPTEDVTKKEKKWKIDVVGRHPNCRCRPDRRGGRKEEEDGLWTVSINKERETLTTDWQKGKNSKQKLIPGHKNENVPTRDWGQDLCRGRGYLSIHPLPRTADVYWFFKITFSFNLLKCQLRKHDVMRL